jgi:hypothetical protein
MLFQRELRSLHANVHDKPWGISARDLLGDRVFRDA